MQPFIRAATWHDVGAIIRAGDLPRRIEFSAGFDGQIVGLGARSGRAPRSDYPLVWIDGADPNAMPEVERIRSSDLACNEDAVGAIVESRGSRGATFIAVEFCGGQEALDWWAITSWGAALPFARGADDVTNFLGAIAVPELAPEFAPQCVTHGIVPDRVGTATQLIARARDAGVRELAIRAFAHGTGAASVQFGVRNFGEAERLGCLLSDATTTTELPPPPSPRRPTHLIYLAGGRAVTGGLDILRRRDIYVTQMHSPSLVGSGAVALAWVIVDMPPPRAALFRDAIRCAAGKGEAADVFELRARIAA